MPTIFNQKLHPSAFRAQSYRRRKNPSNTVIITDPSRRLRKIIGNVKFSIIFHSRIMTYVYEAAIKPDVAEKITSLGDVNEVLTIEKQGNLNIISDLSNAVSLKDVLNLKEYCRFVLKDCKILVADVGTPRYLIMQR